MWGSFMKALICIIFCVVSASASASISTILLGKKVEIYKKVKVTEMDDDTVAVYLEMDGERGLGFTDSNESYFFIGMLFDDDGTNLTEKYVLEEVDYLAPGVKEQFREKPASDVWDVLLRSEYIYKGDGEPRAWVVYASECGYCKRMHEKMLSSGKFHEYEKFIAWVPVSIGGSKEYLAGSAMSLKEQVVVMEEVDNTNGVSEYRDSVLDNTKMLRDKIKLLTPTIVIKKGERVSVIPGMRLDMLDEALGV
jgi:thiol-disulfide isomerase/thioredoxin